jgi:hypothetical protein
MINVIRHDIIGLLLLHLLFNILLFFLFFGVAGTLPVHNTLLLIPFV